MKTNEKALLITWDGFQDQEVIYPYYRLQEEGLCVDIYGTNNASMSTGLFGTKFNSKPVNSLRTNAIHDMYSILVLPGGVKALEKVRQELDVIEFIKAWPQTKVIASICHGAQLLISANKVKNRKISGYYSIKDDILNAGGIYSPDVSVDENIVSGAHYKDMPEWMRSTIILYKGLKSITDERIQGYCDSKTVGDGISTFSDE